MRLTGKIAYCSLEDVEEIFLTQAHITQRNHLKGVNSAVFDLIGDDSVKAHQFHLSFES